jgi:hypothetical protein
MRCGLIVVALLALGACKERTPTSTSTSKGTDTTTDTSTSPAASADASADAPDAPAKPSAKPALELGIRELDVEEARGLVPPIPGDVTAPLRTTADGRQVYGTWCVAGTGADDVARMLGTSLEQAGWTDVASRGDVAKAGVSGERDGYHLSFIVTASQVERCKAPPRYLANVTIYALNAPSP